MAVAVPKRSDLQTAPGPSRTAAPPEPRKRPRDRPRPGGQGRSSAAAPQALRKGDSTSSPIRKTGGAKRKAAPRKAAAAPASSPIRKAKPGEAKRKATPRKASAATSAPARKGTRAATGSPARKAAPQRKKATSARASATAAPARRSPSRKPSRDGLVTAPSRHRAAPRRRPRVGTLATGAAGHAGRAAVAVTQLPESGLIHRLTRGRAWIALLGVLLIGIVGLNVVTLSFAASSGKVQERNFVLSKENTTLMTKQAKKYGQATQRHEAAAMGLAMPETEPQMIDARPSDVAEAAARLAAAAKTGQATSE